MKRLLTDNDLYATLSANARPIAAQFSVDAMTDAVLKHLGISSQN